MIDRQFDRISITIARIVGASAARSFDLRDARSRETVETPFRVQRMPFLSSAGETSWFSSPSTEFSKRDATRRSNATRFAHGWNSFHPTEATMRRWWNDTIDYPRENNHGYRKDRARPQLGVSTKRSLVSHLLSFAQLRSFNLPRGLKTSRIWDKSRLFRFWNFNIEFLHYVRRMFVDLLSSVSSHKWYMLWRNAFFCKGGLQFFKLLYLLCTI